MVEPGGTPARGWQGQGVDRTGMTTLWAAVIAGHRAASAPCRALCPCTRGKVCRAVPDPSAAVWQGCHDLWPLAPAQGPGTLAVQRGVQHVAAAGRLLAACCSAELYALTCLLHWSRVCCGTPGTAALAWLDRGGQEGWSGCCGCSASMLAAGCELPRDSPSGQVAGQRAGDLGSCWHRRELPRGQQWSPMPSLPPGAVAGAAGGKAQDQARRFHGAHRPQVPTAVVPGECWAGAAQCQARKGATQL